MDPILQTFLNWQFLTFGLGVVAITLFFRKIAEYLIANWSVAAKESKLWNDLIMPVLPIVIGAFGALLIKSYPYPNNLTSGGSRFIFGLVAGLLSTVLYRLIKALINQKLASVLPANDSMSAGKTSDDE